MADYLRTGFTTVDATLTPRPFDSVTEEDATVTFRYDATGGTNGGAGAAITWTGSPPTGAVAYGQKVFANIGPPLISGEMLNRPTHMRICFFLAIPTVTGFTTNDRVKMVQVMCNDATGAEIELCSLCWQKTASAYKWIIKSNGATETAGGIFNPTGFAYDTYYSVVMDIVMKDEVGFINVGTAWPWGSSYNEQHAFTSTIRSAFARNSTSHIPTKVNFGSVFVSDASDVAKDPSATTEFNVDDIFICDNRVENPGLIRPSKGNAMGTTFSARDPHLSASLDVDYVQAAVDYPSYAVIGAIPSTNIALLHAEPSNQMAIDEGAVYKICTTMVNAIKSNQDDPVSATAGGSIPAGDAAIEGRGYTQIYTSKYNDDASALPAVPYWGMAQTIMPETYILVPPGHNQLTIYNGEFLNMEVYVHRVRFPF